LIKEIFYFSDDLTFIFSEHIFDVVIFVFVILKAIYDFFEVLGVIVNNLELLLSIGMSVVEIVIILWLRVIVLNCVPKNGFVVWFAIFVFKLSIEAFLLNIVDGHENLGKF